MLTIHPPYPKEHSHCMVLALLGSLLARPGNKVGTTGTVERGPKLERNPRAAHSHSLIKGCATEWSQSSPCLPGSLASSRSRKGKENKKQRGGGGGGRGRGGAMALAGSGGKAQCLHMQAASRLGSLPRPCHLLETVRKTGVAAADSLRWLRSLLVPNTPVTDCGERRAGQL